MQVKNKTIVVTGGGNGLGREIVLNLLEKGAKVVAIDMNKDALAATYELAGKNTILLMTEVADITDMTALGNLHKKVTNKFGVIDGIINNAGIIQPFVKLNDLDMDTIHRITNVNFFGVINVTKTFLPDLLKRPDAHIVNISSLGGFVPTAGQISYCATKAAVMQLSDCLRSELSETHVHITTVFPGAMQTNIKINSGLIKEAESTDEARAGKILHPSVAAQKIVEAMQNNREKLYLGKDTKAMHWIHKISPKLATNLIYKQVKYKFEPKQETVSPK